MNIMRHHTNAVLEIARRLSGGDSRNNFGERQEERNDPKRRHLGGQLSRLQPDS